MRGIGAAGVSPTTFEIGTALAFWYFREAGVQVAVVECGLGGRLDCTNVITPIVSMIAAIGMDHMAQLGDTIEDIAREKAGHHQAGRSGGGDAPERGHIEYLP